MYTNRKELVLGDGCIFHWILLFNSIKFWLEKIIVGVQSVRFKVMY